MTTAAPGKRPGEKIFISQKDNYAGNFGEVLRSSALFWAKNSQSVKTTIALSNYWKYKNAMAVNVVINLRSMAGELISRTPAEFGSSEVLNFTPPGNFDGSVEIEAFSTKNMRIPYAAVMAVYECRDSISMVHSYTRAYSQREIEEKRTICTGEESCWTLRETAERTSFCVIHNGAAALESQIVRLGVRNFAGAEKVIDFELHPLAPFQTVVIEPRKYFPQIVQWLQGEPGNGRISYKLNGGFTRMLCGIKDVGENQLQVTHSNFDYSVHATDTITDGTLKAYMRTPTVANTTVTQEIVVYPDNDAGEYTISQNESRETFRTGQIVRKAFDTNKGQLVEICRTDNVLPTRIVTALRLNSGKRTVPAECSLGVVHEHRPTKHFSWMLVSEKFNSSICWTDYSEIYSGCPADAELVFNLYSAKKKEPATKKLHYSDLPESGSVELGEIFGQPLDLGDEFAYLSIWCSYGGLLFFSSLEKNNSISIEHSF